MKFLIIFLTFFAFTGANNATEDAEKETFALTIDLLPIITGLIESLTNGTYDPYDLGERHFFVDDKNLNIKLDANIKGAVKGLVDVEPKKANVNIIFQFVLELVWPEIHLDITDYNFEGLLGLIKIFGNGKISIKLKNTVVKANGKLALHTTKERMVSLKSIKPDININSCNFEITGYLNDDDRSVLLSNTITNMASILIPQYKSKIDEEVEKIVMKMSEGILIPFPI